MSNEFEIKEVLMELGYSLKDCGTYWQCAAIHRGGDNKTALQIFKNSGGFKDYVTGETGSLKILVEKCISGAGITNVSTLAADIIKRKTSAPKAFNKRDSRIIMEKRYESEFGGNKLFPHYDFYKDRGISENVLREFKGGMCSGGQMYQRFVFPIFNEHGHIIGGAGRDLSNKPDRPKWKQLGRKTDWIYPYHTVKNCREAIDKGEDIIIVESIGDALKLYEKGYMSVLVAFGCSLSGKQICFLNSLDCSRKIIIATNNDVDKDQNPGFVSALKIYLTLSDYFDPTKTLIALPPKGDFGEISDENFSVWEKKLDNLNCEVQIPAIIKQVKKYNGVRVGKSKVISDAMLKRSEKLKKIL